MSRKEWDQTAYFRDVPMAPYDLVKEVAIALVVMLGVVLVLSAVLSSPDVPPVTIRGWARQDPVDFLTTATGELQGTTISAAYGPPYNSGTGSVQTWGPLAPQLWAGVHLPLDPATVDVLSPLQIASVGKPALEMALRGYGEAGNAQQQRWLSAYANALGHATVVGGQVLVPLRAYGPVGEMMQSLLSVARSGGLDALLMTSGRFYETDYTRALLFLSDSGYIANLSTQQHLSSSQWGTMNETGRYPGQAWLWLYTLWYQIPPYNTSSNGDLLVILTMGLLTSLLLFLPFIPGLRDLPRWIPIYRLIWREHYQFTAGSRSTERPVT